MGSVAVSLLVGPPTDISAVVQAGGSLDADTTYYYRLASFNSNYLIGHWGWSAATPEASFTTTSVNKSVLFSWTDPVPVTYSAPGPIGVMVYLTKTPGDYSALWANACKGASGGNYTTAIEGDESYLFTGAEGYLGWQTHMINLASADTYQIPGSIPIGGEVGNYDVLYIDCYGGVVSLQDIVDAIDVAGFSDHRYWDGQTFICPAVLNMTSYFSANGGGGILQAEAKTIQLLMGNWYEGGSGGGSELGLKNSSTGRTYRGCNVILQKGRNGLQIGSLSKWYDTTVSMDTNLPSISTGSWILCFGYSANVGASTGADFKDVNFKNFPTGPRSWEPQAVGVTFNNNGAYMITNGCKDCVWWCAGASLFLHTGNLFYNSEFRLKEGARSHIRPLAQHYSGYRGFYGCRFYHDTGTQIDIPYWYTDGAGFAGKGTEHFALIDPVVVDAVGLPVSGATVSILDALAAEATCQTKNASSESDLDSVVGPHTTDANGRIGSAGLGIWLPAFKIDDGDQAPTYNEPAIIQDNGPFTITITPTAGEAIVDVISGRVDYTGRKAVAASPVTRFFVDSISDLVEGTDELEVVDLEVVDLVYEEVSDIIEIENIEIPETSGVEV